MDEPRSGERFFRRSAAHRALIKPRPSAVTTLFRRYAAKIGCVIYIDALTRRGFELINEIYDQGRLNPIMLENPMVFLSVILTVPRTVPP
jgi:hypothetical protein